MLKYTYSGIITIDLNFYTMRRFFAFAAILIGFVACQNDTERMDVTVGDLEVKVAVTVPESRAGSHEGIFQSGLLGDSLTMRYILQIYYTDPETKTSIDPLDSLSIATRRV